MQTERTVAFGLDVGERNVGSPFGYKKGNITTTVFCFLCQSFVYEIETLPPYSESSKDSL